MVVELRPWIFMPGVSRYRFVYPCFQETTASAIEACEDRHRLDDLPGARPVGPAPAEIENGVRPKGTAPLVPVTASSALGRFCATFHRYPVGGS